MSTTRLESTSTHTPSRWSPPLVPRVSAARRAVGSVLARFAVHTAGVRAVDGGGRVLAGPRGADLTLAVHRPAAVFARLSADPKVGLGEGYTAGDWSAADGVDLGDLLTPFARRFVDLVPAPLRPLRRLVDRALPEAARNTRSGARRNIEAHYDLSDELFALFLDESMTYSSALFQGEESLQQGQTRKVEAVLDLARVGPGTRLLEIGTGWGTLAVAAARRGAQVVTVTLSPSQAAHARDRAERAGVAGRVEVRLQDYRDVTGTFDAIVSVEMIEAVGEEFWPEYVGALADRLAPGGVAVLQSITMAHERYLATRHSHGWIQQYIFPGGLIPSVQALRDHAGDAGLRLDVERAFGADYARTLRLWRERFTAGSARLPALGFDHHFTRAWEFYLAYCEAGFASGYLDVHHLTLRAEAS